MQKAAEDEEKNALRIHNDAEVLSDRESLSIIEEESKKFFEEKRKLHYDEAIMKLKMKQDYMEEDET